ncbi:MAG: HD domain-containing protein [Planctomycetes bacterium]|nr:HD domain-containing protein [Planctomycetota bacterium]
MPQSAEIDRRLSGSNVTASQSAPSPPDQVQRVITTIASALEVEPSIVDGQTGELLHASHQQPSRDWSAWSETSRAVARSGKPEVIDEADPLLTCAFPFDVGPAGTMVAVATFVTRPVQSNGDLSEAARLLGLDAGAAVDWIGRQSVWSAESLERVGRMLMDHWVSRQRIDQLEQEVDSLTTNLTSTYEEISLLHRLTQRLHISSKEEDLGQMALEWLHEALPAESFALELVPVAEEGTTTHDARTESVVLTYADCPLDEQRIEQLIEHFSLGPNSGPLVINRQTTEQSDWPLPEFRQLIVVPLAEGENLFGWLAAVNHVNNEEFGTVEASLLSSVATILGIHSGNTDLYRQQAEFLADVVRAMTSAIDAKDPYTCGHSERVARVAVCLGRELGLDAETLNTIYLSGLLHDVGKIGIDDHILRKPGKLTNAEYEHIKQHPELGYRILAGLKQLDDILPGVLHHHEQWCGGGYPHGLAGEDIPRLARIISVADAFDAMGSDRPYRLGMPDERLDAILRDGSGKQWDERVIEAFFRARDEIREIVHRQQDLHVIDERQWT